jgi:hypothetical protein
MTRFHRRLLIGVVLAAIVAALAWLQYGTREVPAGQPPLAYLDPSSLEMLKADFNRASGETRILVLLSPT